jgi:hypothetical protein
VTPDERSLPGHHLLVGHCRVVRSRAPALSSA